jgi:hypothetical protein
MKKILLVAAMFAVASLNSFGLTACANATLSSLAAGCTITNGAASWDLTLFGFGGTGPSQLGYAADPATSDIFVSFATVTNPSGGGLGFSVTFSDAAGGLNFFNASFGSPIQSADWKTIFVATANNAESAISQVDLLVTGSNVSAGNGAITVQKVLRDASVQGNPTFADGNVLTTVSGVSANPLTITDNQSRMSVGVIDNYQIASGNSGVASLTSYSNIFYAADPRNEVPEPMTFALMGAGLVGIAALRRRKS